MMSGNDSRPGMDGDRPTKMNTKLRENMKELVKASLGETIEDLNSQELKLRALMRDETACSTVKVELDIWLEAYAEYNSAAAEFQRCACGEELTQFKVMQEELVEKAGLFSHKVEEYLSYGNGNLPKTSAEMQAETERLQQEILHLQAQLDRDVQRARHRSATRSVSAGPSVTRTRELPPARHDEVPRRDSWETRSMASVLSSGSRSSKTSRRSGSVSDEALAVIKELTRAVGAQRPDLPKVEPGVYGGSYLEFPAWWSSFRVLIEKRYEDDSDRLYLLSKYTKEGPQALVNSYFGVEDEPGEADQDESPYQQAKCALLARYGDKSKIADAFKRKLNEWPVVKKGDGPGLQKFADFLMRIKAAMASISYLEGLDSREENLKMVNKLPEPVANSWRRKVDRALHPEDPMDEFSLCGATGTYPPFGTFCRFVMYEARVANGPCAERISAQEEIRDRDRRGASRQDRPRHISYRNQLNQARPTDSPRDPKCVYCHQGHWVQNCPSFMSKTPEQCKAIAIEKNACFGCMRMGHKSRECRIKNPALMGPKPEASRENISRDSASAAPTGVTSMNMCSGAPGRFSSFSMPVYVKTADGEEEVLTYALFDTQSDCCFITSSLAEKIGASGQPTKIDLTTMGSRCEIQSQKIDGVLVRSWTEGGETPLPVCYSRDHIPSDMSSFAYREDVEKIGHLSHLAPHVMHREHQLEVGLLIGYNCPELFVPLESVYRDLSSPYAVLNKLGWTVLGGVREGKAGGVAVQCYSTSVKEVTARDLCRAFDTGFDEPADTSGKSSAYDRRFLQIMEEGLEHLPSGHLQLPLPLKSVPERLPDSRPVALKRLMCLKRRLQKNPREHALIRDYIDNMLKSGYAEKPEPGSTALNGLVWHVPIQIVYHPRKPDEPRVVQDLSAETEGVSLNSLLIPGPDLLNNLSGVLMRFRAWPVAVLADIEKMFWQIFMSPQYRDLTRFFWFEGGDLEGKVIELRMAVHLFGATSSPAVANFALKAVAKMFREKHGSRAANFIEDHFYMDDGLDSERDDESAARLILNSHNLCAEGGFNLRKYSSNSEKVIRTVPHHLLAKEAALWKAGGVTDGRGSTLGLGYDRVRDCFRYELTLTIGKPTRRSMLSILSSFFDPLGLISPALLPGRLTLQNLCRQNFQWDDPVPKDIFDEWTKWVSQLEDFQALQVPRCVRRAIEDPDARLEIHASADASTKGYGAAVHHVLKTHSRSESHLVFGKSKVGPSKEVTMPRRELQAAVLAVQLATFVVGELRCPNVTIYYWTDSMVVLGYICNLTKKFHLYVANRVQQIHSRSEPLQWRYIPSAENPADLASRGVPAAQLLCSEIWWEGPEIFRAPEIAEPDLATYSEYVKEDDPEIKVPKLSLCTSLEERNNLLARTERMGDWSRMVDVTAWCKKHVRARAHKKWPEKYPKPSPYLTVNDRLEAEATLVRNIQNEHFEEELRVLRKMPEGELSQADAGKRRKYVKRSSNLYKLDLYLDTDGTARVGGRVKRSTLAYDQKHPRVMPSAGPFGRALIMHFHERAVHMSSGVTLALARKSGFWIIGAKERMNSLFKDCVICRRVKHPAARQKMADLPEDRVRPTEPFDAAAADFFGPFHVRCLRSTVKRWICLFACMASRAVHLEVVATMSTDSFLMAFRRMSHKRGPVRVLYCDQGTNLVGARNELRKAMEESELQEIKRSLVKSNCDVVVFKFNAPKASHAGGSWERLIRTVRSALSSLLTRYSLDLTDEEFSTVVSEAEMIVNSRPIAWIDSPDTEDATPLTPFQVLNFKTSTVPPLPGVFGRTDLYCRQHWRRIGMMAEEFWDLWKSEYLPTLQARAKWNVVSRNMKEGDVVLMVDPHLPRSSWTMGRVTEVKPSEDGLVRRVRVKTKDGEYERPIQKLVPLADAD